MKKLTKKSLEDLANKLPVVSELDQNQMIGGSVYVSPYGVRFGREGHNDTFYMIGSDGVYNEIRKMPIDDRDNQGIQLYYATLDRFSGSMSAYEGIDIQKNVFAAYAKHEISYEGAVAVINDHSVNEDIFFKRSGGLGSGVLNFNVARSGMIFTEEGLRQELFRVRKTIDYSDSGTIPGGSGNTPEELLEIEIAEFNNDLAQLNIDDPKFELQDLRKIYASRLVSLWRRQGKAGYEYEIWDAYKECGVKGY